MFYYNNLFNIEAKKPITSQDAIKEYYRSHIVRFQTYFEENHFLYMYYITGKEYLDESIFIREPKQTPYISEYGLDIDERFANIYSIRIGEILAFTDLVSHLNGIIDSTEKGFHIEGKKSKVFWKGTKAQFYELVYALVNVGVVTGNIKDTMECLSYCLNIKIGNYYAVHQGMRIRKKNRSPFLDLLKIFFLRHMDENDENPQFH